MLHKTNTLRTLIITQIVKVRIQTGGTMMKQLDKLARMGFKEGDIIPAALLVGSALGRIMLAEDDYQRELRGKIQDAKPDHWALRTLWGKTSMPREYPKFHKFRLSRPERIDRHFDGEVEMIVALELERRKRN